MCVVVIHVLGAGSTKLRNKRLTNSTYTLASFPDLARSSLAVQNSPGPIHHMIRATDVFLCHANIAVLQR